MFQTILWPIDGSPLSLAPLQKLIDLALLSRASVVVLSVAEPRLFRGADGDARRSGAAVEAANMQAAKQQVDTARSAMQDAGLECHDVVALSALPSAVIVRTAAQRNCDLIVMATRGKVGMLDSVLNPSCTQEVIKASPVPVLVFP